jgi:hypothetical protein
MKSRLASVDCCNDFGSGDQVYYEGKSLDWDEFKRQIKENDNFEFNFDA